MSDLLTICLRPAFYLNVTTACRPTISDLDDMNLSWQQKATPETFLQDSYDVTLIHSFPVYAYVLAVVKV